MDTITAVEHAPQNPLPPSPSLAGELRESLLLLGCAVAVTVGVTAVAQAALSVLG